MSAEPPHTLDGSTVAILGGTGPQGRGLARRFATAGLTVVLGSRSAERAADAARTLAGETGGAVSGLDNVAAARAGDIVVVAVPWDGHADLLRELAPALAGKVVVDCVNPLAFDKRGPHAVAVEAGSAAQEAAELVPDATVVGAFHNVSAVLLDDPEVDSIDSDVLVLSDDKEAAELVCELAGRIPGVRGVRAGRLRNAREVEGLTANLIAINRRYHTHAGVRITGLPERP